MFTEIFLMIPCSSFLGLTAEKIHAMTRSLLPPVFAHASPTDKEVIWITEFLHQHQAVRWGIAFFLVTAGFVGAVANWSGNLDNLIVLIHRYFTRATPRPSDRKLSEHRRLLLGIMRGNVSKRLADSLYDLVEIDLDREEQPRQVGRPNHARGDLDRSNFSLRWIQNSEPTSHKTFELFNREDIQQRLLILGEQGSGKTIELLKLAKKLLEAAATSADHPLPVIFDLTAWKSNQSISEWLSSQMKEQYRISECVTKRWMHSCQILPLLDGLDELDLREQDLCIKAINEFLSNFPALPFVVCCRREQYEEGSLLLTQLNGAIYLQPIKKTQIQDYLRRLNRRRLLTQIEAEESLLKLAQSPLFLVMLVVIDHEQPITSSEQLLNAYIERQLEREDNKGAYPPNKRPKPEQTKYYLSWLAKKLVSSHQPEFLIEQLEPGWIDSHKCKAFYQQLVGFSGFLVFGLSGGINFGLCAAQVGGLLIGSSDKLISGISEGIIVGLIFGVLISYQMITSSSDIKTGKITHFLWRELIMGLSGGLLVTLLIVLMIGDLKGGLRFGLTGGLMGGLLYGLKGGLGYAENKRHLQNRNSVIRWR